MRGFTLVEVLVALAVVAIGLLALLGSASTYVRQSGDLRDRTHATWIASDRLAVYHLDARFPEVGTEQGEVVQSGERWVWRAVITPAPGEEDLRRVDVLVAFAGAPDDAIVRLTGFVGRHRAGGGVEGPPQ